MKYGYFINFKLIVIYQAFGFAQDLKICNL